MSRLRAVALAIVLAVATAGQATGNVDALLSAARQAAMDARDAYEIDTPDRPLWRDALELAAAAREAAPDDPEAARLLAALYTEVGWHVRAYGAWLEYLELGGELTAGPQGEGLAPAEAFRESLTSLGFSRYSAGDLEGAERYYRALLDRMPDEPEALSWLGRILVERGDPEGALPYLSRATELQPQDEASAYALALAEEQLAVGVEASRAYRQGLVAYQEGRLADALAAFEAALAANARFTEAAVWAGRTALELGDPTVAAGYWSRVVELAPQDERARYFLEIAQTQSRWGIAAGRAFHEGQASYEEGETLAAAEAFKRAIRANPEMIQAWVWAGRSLLEAGRAEEAAVYWEGVLERDPSDERARYFLELARQQAAFGEEAGRSFAEAVRSYDLGEFDRAEQGFKAAVAANPDFAIAWAWLGRLYFTRAEYGEAAEAYGRAAELEPDNEDYAFFAEEAQRLGGGGIGFGGTGREAD